jgi:lysozyme family protein/phage protein D
MRLIAPFCRVRIGEDVFTSGDNTLLELSVDLGEDRNASKCQFSLYDRDLYWGSKYQNISFKKGGIEVPPELLKTSESSRVPTNNGALNASPTDDVALPTGTGGEAILTRPTGRTKAAQAEYYSRVWNSLKVDPPRESKVREAGLGAVKNRIKYESISKATGVPWYVIAAIHYRECTYNFSQNLANGDSLKRKTVRVPAGRIPGKNPPYTFEEAAIDALTSDNRFKGVNWGNPVDLAWFLETYNGLGYLYKGRPSPYLLSGSQHYQSGKYVADGRYNASVIDQQIGTLPIIYYCLNTNRTMIPSSPSPTPPQPQQIQATPTSLQQEVSSKGTEIIIEIGFEPDQTFSYHFIHTGTDSEKGDVDKTIFTGQSIRWLMTRRTENKSFENINLRQLAEIVCRKNNLKLEMEGNGPTYQYLDQTGITTYELLLRQAKSIGYSVKDQGNKLILKPSGRPEFTGIILDRDIVLNLKFGDKARGDRIANQTTPSQEAVAVVDRQTGAVQQQKKEDATGTGKNTEKTAGVTGSAAPAITGNIKPATSSPIPPSPSPTSSSKKVEEPSVKTNTKKNADGSTTTITTTTNKTTERGKVTITETIKTEIQRANTTATTKKITETIETTKGTTINTEDVAANGVIRKNSTSNSKVSKAALESLKLQQETPVVAATANPGIPTDPLAGLPRQPIGSIDLADGRAEGQEIADEAKRIKGYESSATVLTTPEILTLAPGSIIGISGNLVPEPFDREWRVYSIRHKMPGGTTDITFYTPQAAPPTDSVVTPTNATNATNSTNATVAQAPGKFIFPVPKGATTIGDGYGTRRGRPPGYMHKILDVTAPQGTPIVAMADGVVTQLLTGYNGGAGNYLTITYGGGYECKYMHIMPNGFLVKKGDAVKQGQAVAKIGTTGRSSGPHLHLSFTKNGQVCLLSQVGIDVLKMGLPVQRYNATCNKY